MTVSTLPRPPARPLGITAIRRGGARLLAGVALLGLAACASTNATPPPLLVPETVADLIDPMTGRIDPAYAQTRLSLASLVEGELGTVLDANDRRLLDIAFDQALGSTPATTPAVWRNPANGHDGEVALLQWLVDPRRESLCGILGHRSRLGEPPRLEGDLTICRDSLEGDWRIDTVRFAERPAAPPVVRAPRPAPTTAAPAPNRQPAQRRPVATTTRPGSPPPGTAVQQPAPTATDPNRVITRTSDQIVPPSSAGRQNMGDLLEDQAPHTPVQ